MPAHARAVRSWLAAAIVALSIGLAAPRSALAATSYLWASAVSGSADVPNRWSPSGLPGSPDDVSTLASGAYTITYPSGVAATHVHSYGGGNVTLQFSAPHSAYGFMAKPVLANATATVSTGTLNADWLELDGVSFPASLTFTGRGTQVHSGAHAHVDGVGDLIGYRGTSTLRVTGGARLWSGDSAAATFGLRLATTSGAQAAMSVTGYDLLTLARSRLYTVGNCDLTVGAAGTATLDVTAGALADLGRHAYVGTGANAVGRVSIGSLNSLASTVNVAGNLGIARPASGAAAGQGEVTVFGRGTLRVAGAIDVGGPGGDHGSLLRLEQGSTLIGTGGFTLWPTLGLGLDLRGGIFHLRGGTFTWPGGRTLVVSSRVGTPELWLANGHVNAGPSVASPGVELAVGRGGDGRLHLSQPGTELDMGAGATVLGDSTGSTGRVLVDSSAAFVSAGDLTVGNAGNARLDIAGGVVRVRRMSVAARPNSDGRVKVLGPSARLVTSEVMWVGGGSGGNGGVGLVSADSGATVQLLADGGPPTALTVYANGSLWATRGGRIETEGTITCTGNLTLLDGELKGTQLTIGTDATASGRGLFTLSVLNAGFVDAFGTTSALGTLRVGGDYVQTSAGHLRVQLTNEPARNDSLIVTGQAALSGALELETASGFTPAVGDTFTILRCGARLGTFESVTLNLVPLAGQAVIVYEPNAVRVAIGGGTTDAGSGAAFARVRFAAARHGAALSFELELPEAADVDVRLYDLAGREVARLAGGFLGAGTHRLTVAPGRSLASGAYFARAVVRGPSHGEVHTAKGVVWR